MSILSETTFPLVYSLQFLFKSTHHSWSYERKCEWVFFSEHSVNDLISVRVVKTLKSVGVDEGQKEGWGVGRGEGYLICPSTAAEKPGSRIFKDRRHASKMTVSALGLKIR